MKSTRTQERPASQFNPRSTKATDAQNRDERIRQRAYELFEQRMRAGAPGSDMSDWLQAEGEITKS